ncbi:hypothetical protein [Humibacter ginsenosidimutans]|uniref:Uncharacterized protein n=1 Tax=Humibacter ginsenosidimutans TaxID=2599293 RepID=A0A5B8M8E7_9MICO|nr:hypothetical protein [Humibacter ginsenosidimutans]QDZ16479.1 hypothetical protein FPZ11_18540 [Humibacter ginsenosidimutans]
MGCLIGLLALETVGVIVLVIWLIVQAVVAGASDTGSGIALLVIAVLCAVWIVLTTVAAARRQPWMRASSITWHLLVIAVAFGCFTGITAVPQAGWWLLLIGIVGIALVVMPSVTRATAQRLESETESDHNDATPST